MMHGPINIIFTDVSIILAAPLSGFNKFEINHAEGNNNFFL